MLRHAADRRTVAYLGLTTALVAVNWYLGRLHPVLYPLQLFMFFTAAVISHNHNHVSIWKAHWANLITSWVISPVVAGVIAFLLFRSVQLLIFDRDDPLRQARRWAPARSRRFSPTWRSR